MVFRFFVKHWLIRCYFFLNLSFRFVDEKLKDTPKFKYPSFLKSAKLGHDYSKSLKFWTSDLCAQEAHLFDFAITVSPAIGGVLSL